MEILNVVFDCADPERSAPFWSAATGYRCVWPDETWIVLAPAERGKPQLLLQRVPEPKSGKNRVHIDLAGQDLDRRSRAPGQLRRDAGRTSPPWRHRRVERNGRSRRQRILHLRAASEQRVATGSLRTVVPSSAAGAVAVYDAVTIGVTHGVEQALAFGAVRRRLGWRAARCEVPRCSNRVAIAGMDDGAPRKSCIPARRRRAEALTALGRRRWLTRANGEVAGWCKDHSDRYRMIRARHRVGPLPGGGFPNLKSLHFRRSARLV